MIGRVVSTKMNHTVSVLVERVARHPLYKKVFIRSKKYLVDDLIGVKEGDVVEIVKIRPVSKNKHWQVTKVVGRNLEEITEGILKTQAEEVISEAMPEEKKGPEIKSVSESVDQQVSKPEESAEKSKRRAAARKKETK